MKKSLSFTDIILYLISVFAILGLGLFLSIFFQVEHQIAFDTSSYGLFLNTMYLKRLYYCIYEETKNPYLLFYFPKGIEKINDYSTLENCFVILTIIYREILENKTDTDYYYIKYNIRNLSEIPIFVFYDNKNKRTIWIKKHANKLFVDEQKDIWSSFFSFINPINYFSKIIDFVNKIVTKIQFEMDPKNLIDCNTDRPYYISAIFTLPYLAVDSARNPYSANVYKFIRLRGKECKISEYKAVIDQNTGKKNLEHEVKDC